MQPFRWLGPIQDSGLLCVWSPNLAQWVSEDCEDVRNSRFALRLLRSFDRLCHVFSVLRPSTEGEDCDIGLWSQEPQRSNSSATLKQHFYLIQCTSSKASGPSVTPCLTTIPLIKMVVFRSNPWKPWCLWFSRRVSVMFQPSGGCSGGLCIVWDDGARGHEGLPFGALMS